MILRFGSVCTLLLVSILASCKQASGPAPGGGKGGGQDGSGILVRRVSADLRIPVLEVGLWAGVPERTVTLIAQPMIKPRPPTTMTERLQVQAVHDGHWIQLRLSWKDADRSDAGPAGTLSDAVAVQFPEKAGPIPPVFMGGRAAPVRIVHWRAQYQADRLRGRMRSIKEIYPNMYVDMYPFEFHKEGAFLDFSEEQRRAYVPGQAAGNPQSFSKTGVDEILAEGFGSSAVQEAPLARGFGVWKAGQWTVVIARPLLSNGPPAHSDGGPGVVAFAVWQGQHEEVGSRKSVSMVWTPIRLE